MKDDGIIQNCQDYKYLGINIFDDRVLEKVISIINKSNKKIIYETIIKSITQYNLANVKTNNF